MTEQGWLKKKAVKPCTAPFKQTRGELLGASCTVESPCLPSPLRYSEKEPHKLLLLLCSAGKQTEIKTCNQE